MRINDIVRHNTSGKLYQIQDEGNGLFWGIQIREAQPDGVGPRYFHFGPCARKIVRERYTVVGHIATIEVGQGDLKRKWVVRPEGEVRQ